MRRYCPSLLFAFMLALSGCASLPLDYGHSAFAPWVVEQNETRLNTIDSLIQKGKGSEALALARLVDMSELTDAQQARFNLQYAQILLSTGEAEQAIKRLAATQTQLLSLTDQSKFYQSQAFAYSLTGNLWESAKARINLDAFMANPAERKKNQAVILEALGLVPETVAIAKQQDQPSGLAEWVSAGKILAIRNQNPKQFNLALANWRAQNGQHPANIYLSSVANMPEDEELTPKSIAVLLPQSGPFADAAKAVKAGFLAAHSRHNPSGGKAVLHFYDTENANTLDLYQQAIKEGAKLIVGPLKKENIQSLAGVSSLTVPVLALNHVPGLSKNNLYQFALSPLDDVAEITQKAALDGRKKAALLVPENELGNRITPYFLEDWQRLSGAMAGKKVYSPETPEFSAPLKSLLSLASNDSAVGHNNVAAEAGKTPGQPVLDALFISAYSKEGWGIKSQLQALNAGNIAIYAMPNIYSGIPDPGTDNNLNGITFCDIPWLFTTAYGGELNMLAMREVWSQFPSSYLRLVAMGIDAYHLAGRLSELATTPYPGATGKLSLTGDNRIKRNLMCAKFANGFPELLGYNQSAWEAKHNPDNTGSSILEPVTGQ
jgi:uncharacterized protein